MFHLGNQAVIDLGVGALRGEDAPDLVSGDGAGHLGTRAVAGAGPLGDGVGLLGDGVGVGPLEDVGTAGIGSQGGSVGAGLQRRKSHHQYPRNQKLAR